MAGEHYTVETTTTTEYHTTQNTTTIAFNLNYLTSVPGILKVCELIAGLLAWAITASVWWTAWSSAHQYVMFVAVTAWITTLILFNLYMLGCHATKLSSVPWAIIEVVFNTFWAVLYTIASIVSASRTGGWGSLAAATAFAFLATIFYIIDAVIAFRHWKGGCACTVTSSSRNGNRVDA